MNDQKIPILLNCLAAFCGAAGQYFYKKGGEKLSSLPIYLNFHLFAGIALFSIVMVLFVMAYRMGGRISVVYPFYATTFLWGAIIGVVVEKEPFSFNQCIGLGLLFVGMTLLARPGDLA